jgi:hypothetical protein
MSYNAISEEEKRFVTEYHSRIKNIQEDIGEDDIAYTKISLSYAILNNFYILDLLFHPLSLSKHRSGDKPDLSNLQIIKTLEEIIKYELTQPWRKIKLSQVQLVTTISHFRSLERRLTN